MKNTKEVDQILLQFLMHYTCDSTLTWISFNALVRLRCSYFVDSSIQELSFPAYLFD
jgi:hypothetical protein